MLYIENNCKDPYYNLALEEYFLRRKDLEENIMVLWQNHNSVIIGRHQNALAQVNQDVAREKGVKIARRMTGGGAVYHDAGNLNYTFITTETEADKIIFGKFAQPILNALASLGVEAELSGRNDILFNNRKFSGTAQAGVGSRIMFHGTILYDTDLSVLGKVLKVSKDKIQSKGIESVAKRVINLKEYLPDGIGISGLKQRILDIIDEKDGIKKYVCTKEDQAAIEQLKTDVYSCDEWIFGESRDCNLTNRMRFAGGEVEISMMLAEGRIQDCQIQGDFLGRYSVVAIEQSLMGKLYKYEEMEEVLGRYRIEDYFGEITKKELLRCMFDI